MDEQAYKSKHARDTIAYIHVVEEATKAKDH
jgi:hypothetical protein